MAQTFNTINSTDTLSASRQTILDRDAAVQSNFSGTAFPTTNIVVGQFCFRTDLNKLYILKDATPTWIELHNISAATDIVPNANLLDGYDSSTTTTASTVPVRNASGQLPGDITGNAATATTWATARTLSFTGDVTGSGSVNGSVNVATAMTLANSGVTAGSYTAANITVDAKGRVTAASSNSSLVSSFNTRTGAVTLTSADVTTALGFTPFGASATINRVVTNGVSGGSYGSISVSGSANSYSGIRLDDQAVIWMSSATNSAHGPYKDNTTWLYYANNSSQLYTPTYGWLHDYFFSAISNCSNVGAPAGNAGNCYNGPANCTSTQANCGNVTALTTVLEDSGSTVNVRTYRYNYNCNCNCACDCSCVPAGTLVRLADGSAVPIEQIDVGDEVYDGDGGADVVGLWRPTLGRRTLWQVNGGLKITGDHLIATSEGWACIEPDLFPARRLYGVAPSVSYRRLVVGDRILTDAGYVVVESIAPVDVEPSTQLYSLIVSGSARYYADGVCVDGILTPTSRSALTTDAQEVIA